MINKGLKGFLLTAILLVGVFLTEQGGSITLGTAIVCYLLIYQQLMYINAKLDYKVK